MTPEREQEIRRLQQLLKVSGDQLQAVYAERDSLQAQLDEQNGILGELANTPSGAIIAALKAKLAIYATALDNIDRYGMPEQYEQRTASEALAAGKLKTG